MDATHRAPEFVSLDSTRLHTDMFGIYVAACCAEALGSEKKMRSLKLTELKALRGRQYDMLLDVLLRRIPPYSPNSATERKSPMIAHTDMASTFGRILWRFAFIGL